MYLTESGPSSARVLLKSDNDSSSSLSRSHTGNSSRSSLSRRRSKKSYWGSSYSFMVGSHNSIARERSEQSRTKRSIVSSTTLGSAEAFSSLTDRAQESYPFSQRITLQPIILSSPNPSNPIGQRLVSFEVLEVGLRQRVKPLSKYNRCRSCCRYWKGMPFILAFAYRGGFGRIGFDSHSSFSAFPLTSRSNEWNLNYGLFFAPVPKQSTSKPLLRLTFRNDKVETSMSINIKVCYRALMTHGLSYDIETQNTNLHSDRLERVTSYRSQQENGCSNLPPGRYQSLACLVKVTYLKEIARLLTSYYSRAGFLTAPS
ncbi:hypothetical protein VNO77_49259 [Canavalia gladiata]|uniref:Uncharacterized protein n=1 Tax=Canavalia gladiata TaxID=3824 RepID=A0AAN9JFS8_CANGL